MPFERPDHVWKPAILAAVVLAGCPSPTTNDAAVDAIDIIRYRDGTAMDTFQPADANDESVDASDVPSDRPGMDVPMVTTMHARIANVISPNPITMSPPPTIDVCARPAGASGMSFMGPLLAASGVTSGIAWNQVSAYLELPAGHYDLLFVAAPAADCNHPALPVAAALDLSTPGSTYTVLLAGIPLPPDAGSIPGAFHAGVFVDHDPASGPMLAQPLLRLFDALPTTTRFDVGIIMDPSMPATSFLPIFGGVGFGEQGRPFTGLASMFDSLGYYQAAAFPMLTVGARVAGTSGPPILSIGGLAVMDHTLTTAVLTQGVHAGSVQTGALLCIDNAPPHAGLSACQVVFPGP